jgi:hypothetical protein
MASFVHTSTPTSHRGVERAEAVFSSARDFKKNFDGARSLSWMLLAAVVAALVAVADQLMDTWAEGHLLAAWVVLWVVAFVAMALLAEPARAAAKKSMACLNRWSRDVARRRADARLWSLAQQDARIMSDLQMAGRRDALEDQEASPQTSGVRPASLPYI